MIPEVGQFALVLALCIALVQSIVPLIGISYHQLGFMSLARRCAWGQCFFVGIAFLALGLSFILNDFSVAYVAENANTALPLIYRFCAIWGGHAGSLLLWVFILTLWMAAVSVFSRQLPLNVVVRVLAVMSWIACGFYLFLLMTSDPFSRLLPNIPLQGRDLNPVLQDPGLVSHPPILYMGYVGFSVVFAFAIAALLGGKLHSQWARWTRPWTQLAWCFLTLGIVLGSWWAYRELGWGGFWFWDPVENASFLPWLGATALLHALAIADKRQTLKAWTVLLAIITFSLSLLGTFLVRSGALISVHAFANDPVRGLYLLRFIAVVVGGSLLIYVIRVKHLLHRTSFYFLSRESLLLSNNVLFSCAMMIVLLGTLYPLLSQLLYGHQLSVTAGYFDSTCVPLVIPLLLLMGLAPWFRWHHMPIALWLKQALFVLFSSVMSALLLMWFAPYFSWLVWVGFTLSLWVMINTFMYNYRIKHITMSQWAMIVSHVGFAVTIIGLVVVSVYSDSQMQRLGVGEHISVGPYHLTLSQIQKIPGPNYLAYRASFIAKKNNHQLPSLHPSLRYFKQDEMAVSKVAIDATLTRDLYVALSAHVSPGEWGVRVYYKPFVRWIWLGGLIMVVGGALMLFDRRYRRQEFV